MFYKALKPETEGKIMEEEIHTVKIDTTAPNGDIIQKVEYSQGIVSFMNEYYTKLNAESGFDNLYLGHLGDTGMDSVEYFTTVAG